MVGTKEGDKAVTTACLMCSGTGKVLESQNEFYVKLLKWYAESGGKAS